MLVDTGSNPTQTGASRIRHIGAVTWMVVRLLSLESLLAWLAGSNPTQSVASTTSHIVAMIWIEVGLIGLM